MTRRSFLQAATATTGLLPLTRLAAQHKGKVKITDVKCMIVRGTWDWNLIKVETDAGIYGIGEAYWGPGVKDLVLRQLKPLVIGEDPLNVDKLYTKMLMMSAGAGAIAGITVTAASGIEIALWDLAGRILQTPACNLLGGRFRDRVRLYRTMHAVDKPGRSAGVARSGPPGEGREVRLDRVQVSRRRYPAEGRSRVQGAWPRPLYARPHVQGSAAHRQGDGDRARGTGTRHRLRRRGALEIRRARRDQMAKVIEPAKPMWLEDPVPPGNPEAMARVTQAVDVPICTGENLYTRDGFRRLIELQACDIVHIDIPKSGGLLESKRIHDLADSYYIWTAAHNPASPVGSIASCHAAASMRDVPRP